MYKRQSREFAREHSGRLWKQLLVGADEEPARRPTGWLETVVFAVAAAVVVQVARLAADFPDEEPNWLFRNGSLFVLPVLAGYFARRRQLDTPRWVLAAASFVLAALVVNFYPYDADSATEALVVRRRCREDVPRRQGDVARPHQVLRRVHLSLIHI